MEETEPLQLQLLEELEHLRNRVARFEYEKAEHTRSEEEYHQLLVVEQHARAAADEALQGHNAFLSSVSHDLKTPLTAIQGTAQLLQWRAARAAMPGNERLEKGLTLIVSATKKMTAMINDILDLAQLQAGQQFECDYQPLDLMVLAREVVTMQQQTTKRHRIQVEESLPERVVSGDIARLERVFTNLLSNAIKYSPQGGEISVTLSQEKESAQVWAVLVVRDHGLGIPAADLPHIFEPFHRASNVTGRIQGTGIGLASASQIMKQHGGTITVTSEEAGGTTFTVRLPLRGVKPASEHTPDALDMLLSGKSYAPIWKTREQKETE